VIGEAERRAAVSVKIVPEREAERCAACARALREHNIGIFSTLFVNG
jgi:hypothetical protein